VVICLKRDANSLHMVQLMPMPPYHLLFNPDLFSLSGAGFTACPRKEAVKRVSVCEHIMHMLKLPYHDQTWLLCLHFEVTSEL